MPVVALYALAFAGFVVLGFLLPHWLGLVLPPIVWMLFFLWGSAYQETAWILVIPFSVLSMLTMAAGILLGRIHRDRVNRRETSRRA